MLWDVESGERVHAFIDNEEMLLDVAFHPDGGSFYSISKAGELTRWDLNPEIFVLRYYGTPYQDEISADSLFLPKQKGESKKEYQARQTEAGQKKSKIIERYYQQYLQERNP